MWDVSKQLFTSVPSKHAPLKKKKKKSQGLRSKFSSGRGGGGKLERQTSKMGQLRGGGGWGSRGMLPWIILILTPLKCREMHFELINEFLNYYTVT